MSQRDVDQSWVDELGDQELMELLTHHGDDVTQFERPTAEPGDGPGHDIIPMRDGWLRVGFGEDGRMVGCYIDNPIDPTTTSGSEVIVFDEVDPGDIADWVRTRLEIDRACRDWICVLRRPDREIYQAIIYRYSNDGPQRRRIIAGIYPDITLCGEDASLIAYVQPHPGKPGESRAVLESVLQPESNSSELICGPSGSLLLQACSVRRFFKLAHGLRSTRLWKLVDSAASPPQLISIPGAPRDPDMFDVALLDGDPVLIQGANKIGHWELTTSDIERGGIGEHWQGASGTGELLSLAANDGTALLRVRQTGNDRSSGEHVLRTPLGGFASSGSRPVLSSQGLFNIGLNTAVPAVGYSAIELKGGAEPLNWFLDREGHVLNPSGPDVPTDLVCRKIETLRSPDGYEFDLDLRWQGPDSGNFRGPVLLMLYGAYGIDLDLDTDPDLGRWLSHGFAVATPFGRGGGDESRHLAGSRTNRDRAVVDALRSVDWLIGGEGTVTATQVCLVGASAGGFLVASLLALRPDDIDAAVIVNGYVDPLASLLRGDSLTLAADHDEWGDPTTDPAARSTLESISPVRNLRTASQAPILVIIAARDVRVNPRQGLKWFLRYQDLGGQATLWVDPQGTHDRWGVGLDPTLMVDWVRTALNHN